MTDLSDEQLQDEVCTLAGHVTAALCRWLLLVAELDRREAWGAWGIASCAHWLSWRCGLALGTARDHVRVARRLGDLPLTTAGFAAGELSYAKVRALVRVATPEGEAELVALARQATASQLERIVAAFRSSERAALGDAEKRRASRYLRHRFDGDGCMVITARLTSEEGALLLDLLERITRRPDTPLDNSAETPTDESERASRDGYGEFEPTAGEQALADALMVMARTAAGTADVPDARDGDRPHLLVHVDLAAIADRGGRCHLDGGPNLPYATACRLGCEGTMAVVVEDSHGNPLHLGRTTKVVSRHQRRALWARDGGCRFPGCTNRRFVQAHHIVHWIRGGPTCVTNLVCLCTRHHHLVHEGGYTLTTTNGALTFRRSDGTPVHAAPIALDPRDSITAQHDRLGIHIGPDTPGSLANGERCDLALAVDALWTILHGSPDQPSLAA